VIVLDASFLVAFFNERDVHHPAAARVMQDIIEGAWGRALLPEYVFLEVATVLAIRLDLRTAVESGDILLASREVDFIACSDIFQDALTVFRRQPRSALSFADAAIVAVARRENAPFVATFDDDFRAIEGLTVVPE